MKTLLYAAALGLLLTSCGGESVTPEGNSDTTKTDTTAVISNIRIDVQSLLGKYPAVSAVPFIQDSTYLAEMEMEDSTKLSADEVRFLSFNFVESDLSYSGKSSIDDALFFDSLKTAGGYEGYLEVLDIGMMKDANAYTAQHIRLDDSTSLLLWYVDFTTYEACPYFSGKTLYASVFSNSEVKSSTLVGEDSGGGDAPYWSETQILFSVQNNEMKAAKTDRNGGDTDEEGNDIVSESFVIYELTLVNDQWQVTEVLVPVD